MVQFIGLVWFECSLRLLGTLVRVTSEVSGCIQVKSGAVYHHQSQEAKYLHVISCIDHWRRSCVSCGGGKILSSIFNITGANPLPPPYSRAPLKINLLTAYNLPKSVNTK